MWSVTHLGPVTRGLRGAVRDGRRPGLGHFLWPKATQTGPAGNISRSGSQRHHGTALSPACVHTDMSPQLEGPQQWIITPPVPPRQLRRAEDRLLRPTLTGLSLITRRQSGTFKDPPRTNPRTRPSRGPAGAAYVGKRQRGQWTREVSEERGPAFAGMRCSPAPYGGEGGAALGRGLHLHSSPLPAGAIIPIPRNTRGPCHKDNNPFLTPVAAVRRGGCESMVRTAGTASERRCPQLSPRG